MQTARIYEQGNGFPEVGDTVVADGVPYCVEQTVDRIETSGTGGHWGEATLSERHWEDVPEGSEFPVRVELTSLSYRSYWYTLFGERDASTLAREYCLAPHGRSDLDEWLGLSEEAASVLGDLDLEDELVAHHHRRALDELCRAVEEEAPQ